MDQKVLAINAEQVSAAKLMRARGAVYSAFFMRNDKALQEQTHWLRLQELRAMIDVGKMHTSLTDNYQRICEEFRKSWLGDLTDAEAALNVLYPAWYHVRDTLLNPENSDLAKSLVQNRGCPKLSSACQCLKGIYTHIKEVQRDCKADWIDQGLIKDAIKSFDKGIETNVITYVLFLLLQEWPTTIKNAPQAYKAVQKCRNDIKPSGVVLPDQLIRALEDWENVEMLPEKSLSEPRLRGRLGSPVPKTEVRRRHRPR